MPPAIVATANSAEAATLPTIRIRLTILQPLAPAAALALIVLSLGVRPAAAQTTQNDDPFAAGRWHFETALHAALETWNYNTSHEELYGLAEGVTYGVRQGLQLVAMQRFYYVSQRANDTWVLGLTFGVRGRVYHRGRADVYLEGDVGISDAAIATPPHGTRFNYLAVGSSGVVVRLRSGVRGIAGLQWVHVSNNGLKGRSRNPDIEALGPVLGLAWRFR